MKQQPDGVRVYVMESRITSDFIRREVRLTLEAVLVGENDFRQAQQLLMTAGNALWLGPVPASEPRVVVPPRIAEELTRRRIVLE